MYTIFIPWKNSSGLWGVIVECEKEEEKLTRGVLATVGVVAQLELGASVILAAVLQLQVSGELARLDGRGRHGPRVDLPTLAAGVSETLDEEPRALGRAVLVVHEHARQLHVPEVAGGVALLEARRPHGRGVGEVWGRDAEGAAHGLDCWGTGHEGVDAQGAARRGEEEETG